MNIGAGLILFRSTAWKPMENVIATMHSKTKKEQIKSFEVDSQFDDFFVNSNS